MNRSFMQHGTELAATLLVLLCASVSPLMYVAASAGYDSMHWLALHALVPALAVWLLVGLIAVQQHWGHLATALRSGAIAGIAATIALEAVRITGFRVFHAMPGSMPELIGVLLTNRIMVGPSLLSNVLGWGDHFINGIGFATIFMLVFGRTRVWMALLYALAIGTIFMLSPATTATGIGYFGVNFGPGFAITVYLAHIAFGTTLGVVTARSRVAEGFILQRFFLLPGTPAQAG